MIAAACGDSEHAKPPATSAAVTQKTPAAPSAAAARDLIATSGVFSEFEFTNAAYTLPLQQSAMNPEMKSAAADLRKAGWIHFDGDGKVVLTQKAANDKRWLVRQNGVVDLVPLGHKEVDAVTSLTPQKDGNLEAVFDWHWVTNEVGAAFRGGPVHDRYAAKNLRATATLIPDGAGWSVLRIVPATGRR